MGNTFGQIFRITTYGESHGGGVGVVIDGCPPQLEISEAEIAEDLDKVELLHLEKKAILVKLCLEFLKVKLQEHQYQFWSETKMLDRKITMRWQ